MASFLRKNTAVHVCVGPFLDKTDGVTPEVALTVTGCHLTAILDDDDNTACNLILDADATASGGDNDMVHVTDDNAGYYDLELTAAQTNYNGRLKLAITDAATHCPVFHEFMILPAMVFDSLVKGTDDLDVNATKINDVATTSVTTIAANVGTTQPVNFTGTGASAYAKSDVTMIGAAAQSATDLKDFADTGYDPSTHKVAGVVLADTCTTNTDMRGTDSAALASSLATVAGYLDTEIAAILEDTGTTLPAAIAALSTLSIADVRTILGVNSSNQVAELAQAAPSATPTVADGLMLLYMALRNKMTQTSSESAIYNDAGTKIAKAVLSDDGTTLTKAEYGSGA